MRGECVESDRMQRTVMSIACGEFDELWSCVFECVEERVHAVDATEAESSHELDSVSLASAIECFDGGIGLLRREHTAHHSSQVNVHVCVLWPWKQLQQQVRKRQMLVCVHPRLSVAHEDNTPTIATRWLSLNTALSAQCTRWESVSATSHDAHQSGLT